MSRRFKILMFIALAILMIACCAVYKSKSDNAVESQNTAKMLEKAEAFFEKGDYDNGVYQLKVYLQINQLDGDVWKLLGERYEEGGETKKALECYKEVAFLEQGEKTEQLELNLSNPTALIQEYIDNPYVEISVAVKYVKGMTLQVSGKNLTPEKQYYGMVAGALENLQGSDISERTTDWFWVDTAGENLTLTGAFNQAIWQFKDAKGNLMYTSTVKATSFRDKESVSKSNWGYATVAIPEGAVAARVTYWDDDLKESTGSAQSQIYINYGSIPEAVNPGEIMEYPLPDLEEGDTITYSEGIWQVHRKNGETEVLSQLETLELNQGDTISISGDLCGNVTISEQGAQTSVVTDGEYGIRWKTEDQSPVFERVGDAVSLQFNYQTAEGAWVYPLEKNDFDSIYPWSDMNLCAIDASGNITYSDEEGFARDGSCGDVMVEIPVHYFKREIVDGYQYIWISATEREGYQVDPAFVTENGVQEHVYVGAYLNSVENEQPVSSKSDTYVALGINANTLKVMTREKGTGWASLDLVTLQTVQRLFMVETGIRNSQLLFLGNVSSNFGSITDRASKYSAYAVSGDGSESNVIELADSQRNRNFEVGDAVTIFNVGVDVDYYHGVLNPNYQNDENWNRTILSITSTADKTLRIEFSGPPMQIIKQETMMMHLPSQNGKTDSIAYHTGETDGVEGKRSFKYRGMENLWGNAHVILDGATVYNQVITVTYPDGHSAQLSYLLPVQSKTTSNSVTGDLSTICSIGLDPANGAIMLPDGVGEGAIATDGFGDSLFYSAGASVLEENPNILVYGGSWDINLYAGLFNYRMNYTADSDVVEHTGRLIYRENDIN